MKKLFVLLVFAWSSLFVAKADEGMWLMMFLDRMNYADMQKMGLQLSAEQIYSVNQSSLKDAIVQFGNGCTGEIISSQGLLLTNHHCGYGSIQSKSTLEKDYLTDGFWAYSREEELAIEGLTVKFLIRMEDVSAQVLAKLGTVSDEAERTKKLREIATEMETAAVKGTHYQASVRNFFEGNEFYLFVYEIYEDVRLVGAPPSSIGKFGADTDNWMWPRHTGDFSMFRVYCGPDGKPAKYSPNNVPLKPKHVLPVNTSGYKPNDFAMILGYPGTTERYLTADGIDMYVNQSYPTRVQIRGRKLELMLADMQADPGVRIKYASKYAGISNYWKNFIGVIKAVNRLKTIEAKRIAEDEFQAWCKGDANLDAKYGSVLSRIRAAYDEQRKYNVARTYQQEAILGCEALSLSRHFKPLEELLNAKTQDVDAIKKRTAGLRGLVAYYHKNYNKATDCTITKAMFAMYYQYVPRDQQPASIVSAGDKNLGNFDALVEAAFRSSMFCDTTKLYAFLDKPNLSTLKKDPLYQYMNTFTNSYNALSENYDRASRELSAAKRLYVAGLMEMRRGQKLYPDANGTMRLTYGKVMDYSPADAVRYDYFTTLDGVMDKEDPNNWEFVVAPKLKELWQNKDYGPYAENGQLHTCFLTNNDITGGNSGSPVLNAKGELIGLAFDGNWEAMSGNLLFEPEVQRTINVDIRYVLFIIDKYANAQNLIQEMNLVQ